MRLGGLNVLYDEDGNSYFVDDAGQLYVSLEFAQAASKGVNEEETIKEIKN